MSDNTNIITNASTTTVSLESNNNHNFRKNNITMPKDGSSLSNPSECIVRHLKWDASIDFDSGSIHATATYNVEYGTSSITSTVTDKIHLDTRGLSIMSVTVNGDTCHDWILEDDIDGRSHLGQRLVIPLQTVSSISSLGEEKTKHDVDDSSKNTETAVVGITYKTSTDPSICSACQWLPAERTAGGKYPYLFTQCQAIHCRSILPCMDRPSVKMTYEAKVTVPEWATAVMSAVSISTSKTVVDDVNDDDAMTSRTFQFEQNIPIPSYLFALAVGNLSRREISSRCAVISEPCVVDAVHREFKDLEHFLSTAESIASSLSPSTSSTSSNYSNPYEWGRCDVLCLPPSFPYGGMENPCLIFVTPTLLAGDGSLADVVVHEIAHSWTGNLVTNRTWSHFWLNEGWTMWFERKISSKLYFKSRRNERKGRRTTMVIKNSNSGKFGYQIKDDADNSDTNYSDDDDDKDYVDDEKKYFDFLSLNGWPPLINAVKSFPSWASRLVLPFVDDGAKDPDDAYSIIPYEKGFHLLCELERLIGEDSFLDFFRSYLDEFKRKDDDGSGGNDNNNGTKSSNGHINNNGSVDSEAFRAYFERYVSERSLLLDDNGKSKTSSGFDWNEWLYGEGMPPCGMPNLDRTLSGDAESLAKDWIEWNSSLRKLAKEEERTSPPLSPVTDISTWTSSQKTCLLDALLTGPTLSPSTIQTIGDKYDLKRSKNSELLFRFCSLALRDDTNDECKMLATTARFVSSQGRMKYVRPLYKAMSQGGPMGRKIAIDVFLRNRDFYHPIAAKLIASDLLLPVTEENTEEISGQDVIEEGDDGKKVWWNDESSRNLYQICMVTLALSIGSIVLLGCRKKRMG